MYKVFVDHKPVIFIEDKDVDNKLPSFQARDILLFEKEARNLLIDVSLDCPLQITSKNPEKAFSDIFKDYIKIDAAGGLVQRKKSYLLIKRNGLWDIPKGKIDKGERPEYAAIREVAEECGISGHKIVRPLCTTFHTMKYKKRLALKRVFWFSMRYSGSKATIPQIDEGITKVKWMTKKQMLSIRGKTYGSINEVLDQFVLSD